MSDHGSDPNDFSNISAFDVDLGIPSLFEEYRGIKKWPATKQDILAAAKASGAPKETLAALAKIPDHSYADLKAVVHAATSVR